MPTCLVAVFGFEDRGRSSKKLLELAFGFKDGGGTCPSGVIADCSMLCCAEYPVVGGGKLDVDSRDGGGGCVYMLAARGGELGDGAPN